MAPRFLYLTKMNPVPDSKPGQLDGRDAPCVKVSNTKKREKNVKCNES